MAGQNQMTKGIEDDAQLQQALDALGLLRSALDALWRGVGLLSERHFHLLAEGAVDEIARISAEVTVYLARRTL